MSQVDGRLDAAFRAELLDEVMSRLPGHLSEATVDRAGPVEVAADLLELLPRELGRLISAHLVRAGEAQRFVHRLPMGVRQPLVDTHREHMLSAGATSAIDWGATMRHRGTSPGVPVFVTRPARRVFDTPANRMLRWALETLHTQLHRAREDQMGPEAAATLSRMRATVLVATGQSWLSRVPAERPTAAGLAGLRASRRAFYSVDLRAVCELLLPLVPEPEPDALVEFLARWYFEPSLDWKLFEIGVLLRIARQLRQMGGQTRARLDFGGDSRRPFLTTSLPDGTQIGLWYQKWPSGSGTSLVRDAARRHGLVARHFSRPDIVLEAQRNGARKNLLLELKASGDPSYLVSGMYQILGYLADRADVDHVAPRGWLVVPPATTFDRRAPDGVEGLWMVDADDVAKAAVQAVMSALPAA